MSNEDVRQTETSVSPTPNYQTPSGILDSILVTHSDSAYEPTGTRVSLGSVLRHIQTSPELQRKVALVRSIADRLERQEKKKKTLPWFSMAEFKNNHRDNSSFLATKYILLDSDHIATVINDLRARIKTDLRVFVAFISPSGDGLKLIIELATRVTTDAEYRSVFDYLRQLFEKEYGINIDGDDDPSRACFESSDPDMWINLDRKAVEIPGRAKADPVTETYDLARASSILEAFAGSTSPGRTHKATQIIGRFIERGFRVEETIEILRMWDQSKNTPPLGEQKIVSTVRDMYKLYNSRGFAQKLDRFYSYRSDIYDCGIVGENFFMESIGLRKFFIQTEADDDETQKRFLDHVVKEKHIRHLQRVDHIGDVNAEGSFVEYLMENGLFEVHYSPIAVRVRNNEFIEKWLSTTFGGHTDFIKEWLAVYCFTNYRKLPTLVLKGDRGTGKNTFSEAVLSIFPSISQFWHGEEKGFTPEVQKKLLIADESVSANEKQYRMLKQRSGQKMSVVNQKFLPEYQVLNNMNIIVMSNEHTPIFVQKDEEPTSEKNNQFFVYTMPRLAGAIDPDFGQKIEDRMGHYVRTELKDVYTKAKIYTGCRYSIPTPITNEEKALFNVNTTGLEAEGMKFLQKMVEASGAAFTDFFEDGLFPTTFIDAYYISKGYTKNGIVRNLKEKCYLEPADPVRKMVKGKREYCFQMTGKLKTWYAEQKLAQ